MQASPIGAVTADDRVHDALDWIVKSLALPSDRYRYWAEYSSELLRIARTTKRQEISDTALSAVEDLVHFAYTRGFVNSTPEDLPSLIDFLIVTLLSDRFGRPRPVVLVGQDGLFDVAKKAGAFSSSTDYLCLRLIAAYLARNANISIGLDFSEALASARQVIRDSYRASATDGSVAFLLTHVLLCCSAYGAQRCCESEFETEVRLLVSLLPHSIQTWDYELVSEIVLALDSVGWYCQREDELTSVTEWISNGQQSDGGWPATKHRRGSDRRHTTVCAIHALQVR